MEKKILIISPNATHPPYGGNSKCILSYSEMLKATGYEVSFLWVADFNSSVEEEKLTREYWKEKLTIYKLTQFHRLMKAFFRYLRFNIKGYYRVDDFYPYGIKKVLNKVQKENKFDCVIVNYIFFSKVFKYLKGPKKVLFTHDVFTNRFQQTGNPWFSVTANEESRALNRADTILAIQKNEAIFYSYLTLKKIYTVYSYFPVNETPFTGNKVLLFLGAKSPHNVEAIKDFIDNSFKQIVAAHPDIKLLIGGTICSIISNSYKDDSIEFFDEISDLKEFYSRGDIFINPTMSGSGLKIKTFEAMSYGKVIISHPHNTIGIYNREQAPILIAQSTDDYLNQINILLNDRENLRRLKNESIKYIVDLNNIVRSRFIEAIED
jgi:hypothetical protein